MEKADICRLSAKALGKPAAILLLWDPLTNAYQRWECLEWILVQGRLVLLDSGNRHESWSLIRLPELTIRIDCMAAEFPARVVAEIQRRRDES